MMESNRLLVGALLFCFPIFASSEEPAAKDSSAKENLRVSAQSQECARYFAQMGFFDGVQAAIKKTEILAPEMDRAFNFQALAISGGFYPPVIREASGLSELDAPPSTSLEVRKTDVFWEVVTPARVYINHPNWRDWLNQRTPSYPTPPDSALFPTDEAEQQAWAQCRVQSYTAGLLQAQNSYQAWMNELGEAYSGMVLAHKLANWGILKMPSINRRIDNNQITADGQALAVNVVIEKITMPAIFDRRNWNWQPYVEILSHD